MEQKSLYRERPSEQIEDKIAQLKAFEAGTAESVELSTEERAEVLSFEDFLGSKLEEIYMLKPVDLNVHTSYLLTEKGRKDFENVFGIDSLPNFQNESDVSYFLHEKTDVLTTANPAIRSKFEGRTEKFAERKMQDQLLATVDENGSVDAKAVIPPEQTRLLLKPEVSLEKLSRLRDFKAVLKNQREAITNDGVVGEVKRGILNIYQGRTNELLADTAQTGRSLLKKQEIGQSLSEVEQALLDAVFDTRNYDRVVARYDKFSHGASPDYNDFGDQLQIGSSLREYAEQYADDFDAAIYKQDELIRQHGLDPELIKDEEVYTPDRIRSLAEELLVYYGISSEEPADTYNPDRPGPASDGKWQAAVSDQFNKMSANRKQLVIKIPNESMSAKKLFSVGLAHEVEGHALQHTNRAQLGLRLFKTMGSDRSLIFAEAGAMYNQDFVSRKAFGVASPPHAHYIRAMVKKQEGGTFNDCLQTFYDSSIAPYQAQFQAGEISEDELNREVKRKVEEAVNRTRRLFRGGGSYDDTSGALAESKTSVYLEGLRLSEQLREAGLDKYLALTGVNLDTILFLKKYNLFDTDKIITPKYKSLEFWEREKNKFALQA